MMSRDRRRNVRSDSGSALVELAIALPLLVVTLFGTIEFSRVFYTAIELTNAARAGAQHGAADIARSGQIGVMQTTATGAINLTGVTATASRSCQCATNTGTFSATSGGANNCTAPVATSCPGLHRVMFVTVTTTKTFTPSVSVAGVTTIPLSRSATLRVSE